MEIPNRPLLERGDELASLDRLLARTLAGEGGTILVRGAMGVGKTRLLEQARARAQSTGLGVLRAEAGELEQAFSFGVARQLFIPALRQLSAAEREPELSSPARLGARMLIGPEPESLPADAMHATLHGLHWLCVELAAQCPLLLTVDDAHWSDAASLRWLDYLARRLDGVPAALVIAARGATAEPQARLLANLEAQSGVEILELGGLSDAAVHALLQDALGASVAAEVAEACARATGGNPLLVDALARTLLTAGTAEPTQLLALIEELGPTAISRQVRARLRLLGPEANALAAAIAVLGSAPALDRARSLTELSEEIAEHARETLVSAGLIGAGLPLAYVHPMVRSAVLAGVDSSMRSRLHRRAAQALGAAGGSQDDVAAHLLRVEPADDPWVCERLLAAAQAARALGAPDSAVAYLRRALEESAIVDPSILVALGEVEAQTGLPEAPGRLRAARDLTPPGRDRAWLALAEANIRAVRAEVGPAITLLEEAIEDLADQDPDLLARLQAALLSLATVDVSSRVQLADRVAEIRRRPAVGSGSAARILSAAMAMENLLADDLTAAIDSATSALAGGTLLAETGFESPLVTLAINCLAFADRYDEADDRWGDVLSAARAEGSAIGFGIGSAFRGMVRLRMGDLRRAEADARAGYATLLELDAMVPASIALGTLLMTLAEQGQFEAAESELCRWAPGVTDPAFQYLLCARGELRLTQGQWNEALADLESYGHRAQQWRMDSAAVFAWRSSAALSLLKLGQHHAAGGLARAGMERARAAGTPRAQGLACRAAGLVLSGEEGLSLLETAVGTLRSCGARVEHARALIEYGSALRRLGRRTAAQNSLRLGLDLSDQAQARPLADRARAELVAAGARPRRARLRGIDALTASELRVAHMAAAGMTNREIAQDLFVTAKAVEKHLSATFTKLEIRSRTELPEALG